MKQRIQNQKWQRQRHKDFQKQDVLHKSKITCGVLNNTSIISNNNSDDDDNNNNK
jgi:hypothetical protein